MSLLLLFPTQAVGEAEIKNSAVPLVSGHVYRLTFRVRSSYAPQTLELLIRNSTELTTSLNTTFEIPTADAWKIFKFEFTAGATDPLSIIGITPTSVAQSLYFDNFKLIDLTIERKEYRIMRIQGSVLPGSFVQILTLREKTANETA